MKGEPDTDERKKKMKFICQQQNLIKALNIVSKAVSVRTTIPVLKGIMLKAEDGKLTMSASDLDLSIQDTVIAEVSESGSVIVMARLFSDIVRKLPGEEVQVEFNDDKNVIIKSLNSEFKIIGMPADEFPVINSETDESEFIEFDKSTFREMIDKTSFAASIDEARGVITGVLLELSQEEIQMVAIDGFRMAINRRTMYNEKPYRFIIPARILNELSKIIADTDSEDNDKAKLYLNDKKAVFRFGDVQAELKLLEGNFIAYKDILPKSSRITVICDRDLLMQSIERASLLTKTGKNNLIKMNIMQNVIEITSDSDEGNVKEDLVVDKSGDDLIIGFNAHYILDVLKAIDDEKIKILLNSGINPCLIEPEQGDDYQYLVLPVRIS